MQDVKEYLFTGLVRNAPTNASQFVTDAANSEKALDMCPAV